MLHTESLNMHTPRIKSLKLETSSRIVSNLCVSCESAYASLSGVVVMGLSGVSISPSAGDGQHLYLHTVNARCLVKVNNTYSPASTVTLCLCVQEYGGMEFAPEVIKAQIVEMEQLTMTEVT